MNKYFNIILFFLFVLGLFLLNSFKCVWVDETYMAEITYQLMHGNGFLSQADTVSLNGTEQLLYGPVYFYITSFFVWIGGLVPFWFRLTNFLAFFGTIFLFSNYLKREKQFKLLWLFPLLLFLDNSGFENAMSGRMEAVSLFFATSAYFVLSSQKESTKWYYPFAIGSLIALGYLNTPRSVFLFVPMAIYFAIHIFNKDKRKFILLASGTFLFLLSLWIFGKHGGIQEYLDYYLNNKNFHTNEKNPVQEYLFGGFHFSKFQIILMVLLLISYILPKKLSKRDLFLNLTFSLSSLLFLVFVNDFGAYFSMISPMLTFLIVLNLSSVHKFKKPAYLLVALLFLFNVSIFSIKILFNIINENKNHQPIIEMVEKHIPENSRVVFDYDFFYALRSKKRDAYFFQIGKRANERVQYHKDKVDPQYILTRKSEYKVDMYKDKYNCTIIAEYPNASNKYYWIIENYIKKLGGSFFDVDYKNLVIYKLERKKV